MDELSSLQAMGFTLPTPAYFFGMIVFGLIGYVAYRFGKKNANQHIKWLGVVLMFYPYAVASTWLMYLIGFGLCGAIYYYRDR